MGHRTCGHGRKWLQGSLEGRLPGGGHGRGRRAPCIHSQGCCGLTLPGLQLGEGGLPLPFPSRHPHPQAGEQVGPGRPSQVEEVGLPLAEGRGHYADRAGRETLGRAMPGHLVS